MLIDLNGLDPANAVPGSGPVLDLAVGSPAYRSIDGGYSRLFGDSRFSTGRNARFSQMGEVTATDLAAAAFAPPALTSAVDAPLTRPTA